MIVLIMQPEFDSKASANFWTSYRKNTDGLPAGAPPRHTVIVGERAGMQIPVENVRVAGHEADPTPRVGATLTTFNMEAVFVTVYCFGDHPDRDRAFATVVNSFHRANPWHVRRRRHDGSGADGISYRVRQECDERLAMLATVDSATLPLELRVEYDTALRCWTASRELTEGDAHEFHLAVSAELGRDLTAAELRALLGLTPPH